MRPRQYLSWSSLDLFERSRQRWIELYVRGNEIAWNERGKAGIDLGRKVAKALELGDTTDDIEFDLTMENVPKLDVMEMELRAELKRGRGEEPIPLLSKLDTASKDLSAFKEYKQGINPWTKTKVDKSGQITFYSTAAYIITGKIPQDIELIWIPTELGIDGQNRVTGEIVRFRTRRTMSDVLNMMVRMRKAWDEMELVTDTELL